MITAALPEQGFALMRDFLTDPLAVLHRAATHDLPGVFNVGADGVLLAPPVGTGLM